MVVSSRQPPGRAAAPTGLPHPGWNQQGGFYNAVIESSFTFTGDLLWFHLELEPTPMRLSARYLVQTLVISVALFVDAFQAGQFVPLARMKQRTLGSSGLHSRCLQAGTRQNACVRLQYGGLTAGCTMVIDPTLLVSGLSGTSLTSDDIAGGLFAASLFPYLAFLYYLVREWESPLTVSKRLLIQNTSVR